jgi:hypothetical protein
MPLETKRSKHILPPCLNSSSSTSSSTSSSNSSTSSSTSSTMVFV